MDHQTSPQQPTQQVYEDGLIVSQQPSNKIPASQEPYSEKTVYQIEGPASRSAYPPTTQLTPNGLEGQKGNENSGLLKRKTTWIIIALVVALVALAGIVGGIASGSIKTNSNSGTAVGAATTSPAPSPSTSTSPTTTPGTDSSPTSSDTSESPSGTILPPNPKVETTTIETKAGTVTLECPSADGLDYNLVNKKGQPMAFARYCDVNFPDAQGDMGLVENKVILSMPECIAECANTDGCVGVVFESKPACWLKRFIGMMNKESAFGTESAILQQ